MFAFIDFAGQFTDKNHHGVKFGFPQNMWPQNRFLSMRNVIFLEHDTFAFLRKYRQARKTKKIAIKIKIIDNF